MTDTDNITEYMAHLAASRKGIETYHGAGGPRSAGAYVLTSPDRKWVVVERHTLLRESDAGCLVSVSYEAKRRPLLAHSVPTKVAPALAQRALDFAVMYGEGRVEGSVGMTISREDAARLGLLDMPTLAEREHLARIAA